MIGNATASSCVLRSTMAPRYTAVEAAKALLSENEFEELCEGDAWNIDKGGKVRFLAPSSSFAIRHCLCRKVGVLPVVTLGLCLHPAVLLYS